MSGRIDFPGKAMSPKEFNLTTLLSALSQCVASDTKSLESFGLDPSCQNIDVNILTEEKEDSGQVSIKKFHSNQHNVCYFFSTVTFIEEVYIAFVETIAVRLEKQQF